MIRKPPSFRGANLDNARSWAGRRPATAQGKPIIGETPYRNLSLNVGHGALGFTLACGSARPISDFIDEKPAALDATPLLSGLFTEDISGHLSLRTII